MKPRPESCSHLPKPSGVPDLGYVSVLRLMDSSFSASTHVKNTYESPGFRMP